MKNAIRVVVHKFAKRGRFIDEGSYEYCFTPEGAPAMQFRWRGMLLSGPRATFAFPRDVVKIGRLSDDVAKSQSRSSGFLSASEKGGAGEPVASLVWGAIGAAAAPTSNINGFAVLYRNPEGHLASFIAIASPEIVDEIFSAVPHDRHEGAQSPEAPPSTQPSST